MCFFEGIFMSLFDFIADHLNQPEKELRSLWSQHCSSTIPSSSVASQLETIMTLEKNQTKEAFITYLFEHDLEIALDNYLAQNSDTPHQGSNGNTLLHLAVFKGRETIIKILFSHGYHWHEQNKSGKTPAMYLFFLNDTHLQNALFSLFLTERESLSSPSLINDLLCTDNNGYTFLHYCAIKGKYGWAELIKNAVGQESFVQLLNQKDKEERLPIHRAILNGLNSNTGYVFYDEGLKNTRTDQGYNLYLFAIKNSYRDWAVYFRGNTTVDCNKTDFRGNTVWHLLNSNDTQLIHYLKTHHAQDISTPNNAGIRPSQTHRNNPIINPLLTELMTDNAGTSLSPHQ